MNYLSAMLDANIPWHNPDRLTPAQVDPKGEGWRLLLKEEIDRKRISYDCERWYSSFVSWDSGWSGNEPLITYRTKWPLPEKYQSHEGFPPGLPSLPEPHAGHRWAPHTSLFTQPQPQTTMNKIPYINTTDQPELFEMICQLGEKLGGCLTNNLEYRYNHGAIAFDPLPAHPLRLDGSCLSHWRENPDRSKEVSVQTFVELMRKAARKGESVKLNDKHTAIVAKDGVKVGCQSFPLSVIDDLAEAKRRVLG